MNNGAKSRVELNMKAILLAVFMFITLGGLFVPEASAHGWHRHYYHRGVVFYGGYAPYYYAPVAYGPACYPGYYPVAYGGCYHYYHRPRVAFFVGF